MKHEHMAAWTPEEDKMILKMYAESGRKWGKIAAALPNRTSASVRNRYLRIEKGDELRRKNLAKNRCAACGLHKLGHVCTAKLNVAGNEPSSALAVKLAPPPIAAAHALASLTASEPTALPPHLELLPSRSPSSMIPAAVTIGTVIDVEGAEGVASTGGEENERRVELGIEATFVSAEGHFDMTRETRAAGTPPGKPTGRVAKPTVQLAGLLVRQPSGEMEMFHFPLANVNAMVSSPKLMALPEAAAQVAV